MKRLGILAAVLLTSTAAAADRKYIQVEGTLDAVATPADLADPPEDAPYEPAVYAGAKQMSMSLAFIDYARSGLDLLYKRQYRDVRGYFAELEEVYPGTAVSSIADMLVWQSVMLENFDFRHDAQYKAASEAAERKLTAALEVPGNESWEHFMLAGVVGIESIHAARQGRYLPALTLAFKAIDHVEKVRENSPDFVDLKLADGLYNYWRTVLTKKSKALPDFGDKREEGITQVQDVEDNGIFLAPPATLSMAFTWIEERDYAKAVASCERNQAKYPNNLINELMLGITRLYQRDYDGSLTALDHVLELDKKNKRARYYKGLALFRSGQIEPSMVEFETYLASDYLEDYQRAAAHYRMGAALYKLDRYDEAETAYKAAVKINGHSSAKASLDQMKKARKEGKIP
jgi:tetratricopeptide (TPR) repeat protein